MMKDHTICTTSASIRIGAGVTINRACEAVWTIETLVWAMPPNRDIRNRLGHISLWLCSDTTLVVLEEAGSSRATGDTRRRRICGPEESADIALVASSGRA